MENIPLERVELEAFKKFTEFQKKDFEKAKRYNALKILECEIILEKIKAWYELRADEENLRLSSIREENEE